jgi:hypothetical protein
VLPGAAHPADSRDEEKAGGFMDPSIPGGVRRLMAAMLSVVAAFAFASCGDNKTPTEPTPTPTPVTESFSGQLTANGATTHTFTTASSGTVTGTVTALEPDDTLVFSIALGTWNGTNCTLVVTNDAATKSAIVSGTVTGATTLCLRVADVGKVTTPATYTVEVVHP